MHKKHANVCLQKQTFDKHCPGHPSVHPRQSDGNGSRLILQERICQCVTPIIERLRVTLMDIYGAYLRSHQRACVKAIENLWSKYAVTARQIEAERDTAAAQLQAFLVELGYD